MQTAQVGYALSFLPLGERDILTAFLAPDGSKRKGILKGGQDSRRNKIVLWDEVEFSLDERPERESSGKLQPIELWTVRKSFFEHYSYYEAGACLHILGNLANEFAQEELPQPALYRLFNEILLLFPEDNYRLPLLYTSVWLLRFEGLLPDIRRCALCKNNPATAGKPATAGRPTGGAIWRRGEKIFLCKKCAGAKRGIPIDNETRELLLTALRKSPKEFCERKFSRLAVSQAGVFADSFFGDILNGADMPNACYNKYLKGFFL